MKTLATALVWLGIIPAAIYVGMTGAFRLDLIGFGDLFSALRAWLGMALFCGAALGVAGLLLSVVSKQMGQAVVALIFAVLSGSVVYSVMEMKRVGGSVPPIHDITTDTIDPPAFSVTAAERLETENPAAYDGEQTASQIEAYPDLAPIVVSDSPADAFAAAEAAMAAAGVKIKSADAATGLIEGTATTFWFGFKDDVVIRVRAGEGDVTVIDIRSKSRFGRSDLGANATRIREIRDAILKQVSSVDV